ncbi:UDP-glucosyltransferase 2-like [Melitaea cinxia]|uniref:UDP-glucosyltransferase 2-like n=1 Tax=Melitaea cinxia TaxID=113334 RepID=UPI001E272819|nr:UDP-glucosyltransferase 2-like [Melitaea cinxia]
MTYVKPNSFNIKSYKLLAGFGDSDLKTMTRRTLFILLLTINILALPLTEAYKILLVSPMPARSHSILGDGLVRHLSQAGHEITYITAVPHEKPMAGVKEIDVSSNFRLFNDSEISLKLFLNNESKMGSMTIMIDLMATLAEETLKHSSVQKLLENPTQEFDVIIGEWMMYDLYVGLSAIYRCPYIWFSSVDPHWKVLRSIHEMSNPVYVLDSLSANTPLSYYQRLQELGSLIKQILFNINSLVNPRENEDYERILVPIIRKRGYPVPSFEELRYNVSLVLGNSHESLGRTMALPANYINIGGYHIDTNVKPLPEELKKIMDNAKHGVIYFSMGSNLNSQTMPDELKQSFLKMFGSLKQTVLWKFEDDLPNKPNNVHILKWAPQPSILNHPNCILFITHGGLLSTTETVHFGKPIIGIPVFGDQFSNIDKAVAKGYAKRVDLSYTMADDIKIAIDDILGDPKYNAKLKELSIVYHNRAVEPAKNLVHWVEFVVKTGGARHLRSPALDVPRFKILCLDLIFIIIATLYIIKISVTFAFKKIIRKMKQFNKSDKKKQN